MSVPESTFALHPPCDEPAAPIPGRPAMALDEPVGADAQLAAWLTLVCRMIPDVSAALAGFSDETDRGFKLQARWPAGGAPEPELHAAARRALQRDDGVVCERREDGRELLARRLLPGRSGAIAIAMPALADNARHAVLQLLEWSALWLDFMSHEQPPNDGTDTAHKLLIAGLDADRLPQAATRMAAIVATSLGAERVSIGMRVNDRIELLALSHSAAFNPRLQLNRDIVAAMEETLDESRAIVYPAEAGSTPVATHAHARLCSGDAPTCACSVPLIIADNALGVIIAERPSTRHWSRDEQARLSAFGEAVARILSVRQANERTLRQRTRDAMAQGGGWLRRPGDVLRKALLAMLVLGVLVASFGSGQLQIAAPAVLEGNIHRSLTAPIDGYITEAPARAGDAVKAGDVIAVVDTQSLQFERRRWVSERAEYEKAHRRAVAELDRGEATIMQARLGRANSQLALIEEQLKRARVVAPFDGMIITGDLSRSMGAPVSRGDVLFEIAPLDDYRVELDVDEADIASVAVGQTGHLALTALPGKRLAFTVDRITNVAETSDRRNVFKVEGHLDEDAALLRPGMRGVGKIASGEHRLIWVWTHRIVDRIRLWLWSRAP